MKRVLVAEDHEAIAAMYKLVLESENICEVVVTRDGQECIETYHRYYYSNSDITMSSAEQDSGYATESVAKTTNGERTCSSKNNNKSPFDLVILDYHMPQKDGIEVARHILSMVPEQRILIASSYPRGIIVRSAETLNGSIELMVKPFELEDFAHTVEGLQHGEVIEGDKHPEITACCNAR